MCMCACVCVCDVWPSVFNTVPEGFNPDYQKYKVTESSQLNSALSALTSTHAIVFWFSVHHTHTHTFKSRVWVRLSSRRRCVLSDKDPSQLVHLHSRHPVSSRMQLILLLRADLRSVGLSLTYFSTCTVFLLPHLTFMIHCLTQNQYLILWQKYWGRYLQSVISEPFPTIYSFIIWCVCVYRKHITPVSTHGLDSSSIIYIKRCDLHIGQSVWIYFSIYNLIEEIDACSRVGCSVNVSSYSHSHTSQRRSDWLDHNQSFSTQTGSKWNVSATRSAAARSGSRRRRGLWLFLSCYK